jgi:phosphoribosylglycinamide formyltransferase-1
MAKRIAVLVSGGGTNLQALIDAGQRGELGGGEIAAVISSKAGAYALERAANAGIPGYVLQRKSFESNQAMTIALVDMMKDMNIDLVVLAGCMIIFTQELIDAYPNAIINVHPALIPSFCGQGFYGLHVHEEALKYILELKNAEFKNILGIDFISKQTLITEKNPYIPKDEYIKRFLWE